MADPGDPHSPDDQPPGTGDRTSVETPAPGTTVPTPGTHPETHSGSTQRPTWPTPLRGEPSREDAAHAAAPLDGHDPAHDDLIGFTSPASLAGASLAGASRTTPEPALETPAPEAAPDLALEPAEAEPDLFADLAPKPSPSVEPVAAKPSPAASPVKPGAYDFSQPANTIPMRPNAPASITPARPVSEQAPGPGSAAVPAPVPSTVPAWAMETPRVAPSRPSSPEAYFGRAGGSRDRDARPEGAMSLYTVYALILFAVPTLGVSALVALVAIHGRTRSQQGLALSHQTFQARTLWISAFAAIAGVAMIAVNLGVFVLFFVAVWVLLRGAFGLLRLAAGRPIAKPRGWLL
ncbi:hypothetical protein BH10PSE2_BH10PSE2_26210 [soil metagenome]